MVRSSRQCGERTLGVAACTGPAAAVPGTSCPAADLPGKYGMPCDNHRVPTDLDQLLTSKHRPLSSLHFRYRLSMDPAQSVAEQRRHLPRGVEMIGAPARVERLISVWRLIPDRARVQFVGGRRDGAIAVRSGARWQERHPGRGIREGVEGDGQAWLGRGLEDFLDTSSLPVLLRLEAVGRSTCAGHSVIEADAWPRSHPPQGKATVLRRYGAHAERYRFAFDVVHGLVLRALAYADDEPFQTMEALEAHFDQPIDEATFTLDSDPEAS